MTAHERLHAACAAARRGEYEQALQEYIWFHHHALAEDPSLIGVRVSFALGFWIDLGADYPPALRALETIRDDYADRLMRGDAGVSEFRDVVSINEHLGATAPTYELYKRIKEAFTELAAICAGAALPAVVDANDFGLALELLPDPESRVEVLAKWLNEDTRMIKVGQFSRAPQRWCYIGICGAELGRMLMVLSANGLHAEASRIKALALRLTESPSVRRDLAAELVKPAKAPMPRHVRRRKVVTQTAR